ncbi:MAG: phosphatase PAP2 family protein [Halanaerobiales bacterium]
MTFLGDETFFILLFSLVYWCINKKFAYFMGFAFLSSGLINTVLKEVIQVSRPIGQDNIRSLKVETAPGYSFPSGHAQMAASYWTSLMIEVRKSWFTILGVIIILIVGISRIYLGLHTLQDVLGGIIFGVVWVYIANRIFSKIEKERNYKIFLWIIIPMILGLFIFQVPNYFKVFGSFLGLISGYIIESEVINFREKEILGKQILKYIIGIAGVLLIRTLIKTFLPEILGIDLLRYYLIVTWITVFMPYLIKKLLETGGSKEGTRWGK